VKQLARKSALNARAREGALHVVEQFAFRSPKTARLAALLASLGLADRKVLVLSAVANEALYLSGRNLPSVEVMPYVQASAYDILWSDAVVIEEGALNGETRELGEDELPPLPEKAARAQKTDRAEKPARKAKAAAPKPAAKAKTAKKAAAPKAAKKAAPKAAKKSTAKSAKNRAKGEVAEGKAAPKKKKGDK
jgi:hypothetical protein